MDNYHVTETMDVEVLAQFLRECEPPTPPCTASSSCLGLPPASFFSHNTDNFPTSALELEEEDKQAILAALDAYNSSAAPSTSSDESGKTRTQPPEECAAQKLAIQRAMATKRRNRHRARVKLEWQTLQLQYSELSGQLAALKRARLSTDDGVAQLKWQALASKELAERMQAQAQQKRVRSDIERRVAVMQSLQELINSQPIEIHDQVYEWEPDDFKMYDNFMLEVIAAYARTDAALHECGLGEAVPSNTSFYKPARKRDALRNADFFESTSSFVLPCQYPKAANAMFDSMRQVHRQNPRRRLFEAMEDLPNTIAVKFGTVFHCEEGRVLPLRLIIVIHRFVGPGRTVLVWRGLIAGEGDFAGTYLDSTGWCVLRPAASGAVDSTDVRTCIHLVPIHLSLQKHIEGSEGTTDIAVFTESVLRSAQQDKLELARLMQELLLDSP
ncbi:hypothetical protein PC128_g11391 [Phytophthora cactorum]|nr:hypothetical protein PC120_g4089 [Phytophthora cactorum]KAG3058705.1 hypothetical protein PC121_g14251 [Phytophthora cactorum]KAG3190327.1 hypothetical protein PC128_g11391 [Phytophthora cactorum]KAG4051172.1 hypothetical protein PC123_g13610 [Phytophthora cactorum]